MIERSIRALAASLVALPAFLAAQTCEPSTNSHEADIFGIRALSLVMSRGSAITSDAPGTVRAGVEGMWLPTISDETATPTECRPGKGPENVNSLAGAARARVSVALPLSFTLDASWLPPVTVKGMRGNLFGIALGTSRALSPSARLGARVHATFGSIKGAFVCPDDAVNDAASECHLGTVSTDRLEPNVFGGDVTLGWTRAQSAYGWYGGAGYSRLTPRFQVHFVDQFSVLDTTRVQVGLNRLALFAGVSRAIAARWRVSGELYATTRDGATARIVFDRVLHAGR
jgi:hypothetical protein